MRTKDKKLLESYNHQRRKEIPFFSLARAFAFSCSLEALI